MLTTVKNETGKRKYSVVLVVFLLLVAAILSINIFRIGDRTTEKNERIAELIAEIENEQLAIDELNDLLESGNELEYIERIAREKYGYVAPGERAFYDSSAGK